MSVARRVRFNDQFTTIHEIMSRKDYTAEEAQAAWMSKSELFQIKKNIRKIVILMNQGSAQANSQSEKCCTRGLEHFTPQGDARKKKNNFMARQTVLMEQHRQYVWRQFIHNPERLADLYREVGNNSRIAARANGILDAEYVAAATIASINFSVKPRKGEIARPEIIEMRELGVGDNDKVSAPISSRAISICRWMFKTGLSTFSSLWFGGTQNEPDSREFNPDDATYF
jgi:hypothetical protein